MNYSDLYNLFTRTYGRLSHSLPAGYALPPIHALIELTYGCNLACKMCYQNIEKPRIKKNKELSTGTVAGIIDSMPPKTLISFNGGEIFTRGDLFELIEYAGRRHFCNIVTNATLINEETAKKLVNSKLTLIGISLDGLESTHDTIRGKKGAYKKTTDAIKLIQKEKQKNLKTKPEIDIKTLILPENVSQLFQLYEKCCDWGVNYLTLSVPKGSSIQLSPPILKSIADSEFEKFNKVEKTFPVKILDEQLSKIVLKNGEVKLRFYPGNLNRKFKKYFSNKIEVGDYEDCYSPWFAFNVSPYGKLFPCISLDCGDLNKIPLNNIWNGQKMREFRLKLNKEKVFPCCQGCCNLQLAN